MKKLVTILMLGTLQFTSAWGMESYSVEVVEQPLQKWRFNRVQASPNENGSSIRGRLTSINRFGLPKGHVDIAAYSPSGELLAKTTTSYIPSRLSQRAKRKGGVKFSAQFNDSLPVNSIIKLAFHRNSTSPEAMPVHNINIAQ